MNLKVIKRAIISVSNKSNLRILLPILKKFNIEIISSGGTFREIKRLKYNCIEVSNYTGFSEILDGRVKTLHPKIHAGILGVSKNKKHRNDLKKNQIPHIDLVVVDLYPFEDQLKKRNSFKKLIEYIDVGGPTLIRSAAKNFNDVVVISNPNDYFNFIKELKTNKGSTNIKFRKFMSAKAFGLTAYYDSVISTWFNEQLNLNFPERKTIHGKFIKNLRYGENPHQRGKLYATSNNLNFEMLHGKDLSYNNYNDTYAALSIIDSFKKNQGAVIIKHANPSGVSIENNQIRSFRSALSCDPVSAFGGVVAINSVVLKKLALELNKIFFEVIIARGFNKDALEILKRKKNIRLINCDKFKVQDKMQYIFLEKFFLMQDINKTLFSKKLKIVTKNKPSKSQMNTLKFAFNVCKHVKSNAIVLAKDKSTIGIGSGQPSRLDSSNIASNKALKFAPEKIINSVAASDAFFPFPDGVEKLIKYGVKAIIQPGGSKNDSKVIATANKANIAMVFTGTRHFKH